MALSLAISRLRQKGKLPAAGTDNAGGGGAAKKHLKLAFVSNNAANFWTIARAGCMDAKTELGDVDVDFTHSGPAAASAEQQQILDDLVARGIDGIAVSPIDPANQTDFLNKIASCVRVADLLRQRRGQQQARLLYRAATRWP